MADDAFSITNEVARVRRQFEAARIRFQADTNNAESAWQFGRACSDLTDVLTNITEQAGVAEQGIAACRQSIARNPASAPAHYYLGVDLGHLADTKRNLAALRMVKEMEREFQAAADLDEQFDHAGPDRSLGLLYLQAPVLVSIGSRTKARQHLRHAVELAPDYPENRLILIEACLKWSDVNGARREVKILEELWPGARKKFSGEAWEASWQDWGKRFKAAKHRIDLSSRQIESPRHED